jgi:cAMP-dependent protein kinase regulator
MSSLKPALVSAKELAQKALARGDLKKALEHYQVHCSDEPGDLRSRIKVGELFERLGRKEEAILTYRNTAEAYAKDGFILQAISLTKKILRVDPGTQEIHDRLARLYHKKMQEVEPLRPLPSVPLLADLSQRELRSLLQRVRVRIFSKGDWICREGEAGNSMMSLIRGLAEVRKKAPNGKEIWIRKLGEGDFLGEFGFFTDGKRHATVKALIECELLEISRDEMKGIIKSHPRVKEVMEQFFHQRVLDTFFALSPLFAPLSPPERQEVLKRFRLRKVPEGTVLFKRGDPPGSLYLVKKGSVEIYTEDRNGRKVSFVIVKSGNFFGEIAPLLHQPRTAHAKTIQSCELLELVREDLDALVRQFPRLGQTLKEISLARLSRMKEVLSRNAVEKSREIIV